MEDLPDDFAIALGRVLYLGGRVEMLLDRLLTRPGGQPLRLGLSGAQLIKELRKIITSAEPAEAIVDGYEAMHEGRNHLVHGAHQYANGVLWTWREPSRAKGNAALSFQFGLEHLQGTAQSWQNLADAVYEELRRRNPSAAEAD
ncbi:hypothetical protein [Williamsia muralis]|nr:hypothetical protein [Williamsia muralis]